MEKIVPIYVKQTLKSLRVRLNLSQDEAAKHLGISVMTLRKLEVDSSEITFDMMKKVSELYVCPLDYIFFGPHNAFSGNLMNRELSCTS
ncbi:helix-turn-helix transcriptional regulator [Lysinibacillus sp. AR18-8]|uniref:helix-turn-helix domain-containing protein n=1 Tax=Lysinibacillus sp. AR18-8 TaxID=1889781 RepID=UPI001586086C|nr:helix-turn-helix transcriptional regulator [Lysinibacillus sp. AR18-8]